MVMHLFLNIYVLGNVYIVTYNVKENAVYMF